MTPEQIYRALCIIDPALEPYEKCAHRWQANPDNSDDLYDQICANCGDEGSTQLGLLEFGDREPKYQSVDELLSLCERLGLFWELYGNPKHPYDSPMYHGVVWERLNNNGRVRRSAGLSDKAPVAALSEAILRATGGWPE